MSENIEVITTKQLTKPLREHQVKAGRTRFHSRMEPNPQNEFVYHGSLFTLRTILQRLRDAQDHDKPSSGTGHVPHHNNEACGTADVRVSIQLLNASSAVPHREEPHHVGKLSDDWNAHGWENLPSREQRSRRYGRLCAQFTPELGERYERSKPETKTYERSPGLG